MVTAATTSPISVISSFLFALCIAQSFANSFLMKEFEWEARGGSRTFSKGVTFVMGWGEGVTIHFLNNKICELGACFLYLSYLLA